jgi:hypothetical protein
MGYELFVRTALDAGAFARGQSDDAFLTGQISRFLRISPPNFENKSRRK